MMARKISVEIVGDATSLSKAFGKAADSADSFGSKMGKGLATVAKTAVVAGAAVAGGFALVVKKGFDELGESQKVAAQTEAVIKATGGAANVSAKQVSQLAEAISKKSGIDDEAIQSGSNLLLTFKNVRNEVGAGNDVFNQATKAAVDLSVAGFGSIESASKMMGKALNDPVAGLTALSRAGVTFTAEQKKAIAEMVKTGDVLGAQKVILEEVTSQVGGSAEAFGNTLPGQLGKLRNAFDEVAGRLAVALLPALTSAMGAVTRALPHIEAFASAFIDRIAPYVQQAAQFLRDAWPQAIERARGAVAAVLPVLETLGNAARDVVRAFIDFNSTNWGQALTVGAVAAGVAIAALVKLQQTVEAVKKAWAAGAFLQALQGPAGIAAVAIGGLAAAFYLAFTRSDQLTEALKRQKEALNALRGTADSLASAQLRLKDAKIGVKQASIDMTTATSRLNQVEQEAGRGSQQYKQALIDVERAAQNKKRALLEVSQATDNLRGEQEKGRKATSDAEKTIGDLVNAYNRQVKAVDALNVPTRVAVSEQSKLNLELKKKDVADDFAGAAQKLAGQFTAIANETRKTNPALAATATKLAEQATRAGELARKYGEIPTAMSAAATGASGAGSRVGADFAAGMSAGIASAAGSVAAAAANMVRQAEAAARTEAQSKSPSMLFAKLGHDTVEGYILGIQERTPAIKGKMAEAITTALEDARRAVAAKQDAFRDAFGTLGEYAARAFQANTDAILSKVTAKWDARIATLTRLGEQMTPAEKELKAIGDREAQLSRDNAVKAAKAARDAATVGSQEYNDAVEALRQANLANHVAALEKTAERERLARDNETAAKIKAAEETKARELRNWEERRRQDSEQLEAQLATLKEKLAKHPEQHKSINKQINKIYDEFGITMTAAGKNAGKSFAKGLDESRAMVRKSAEALAEIVAQYLKSRSPTEKGPMSTLDTWWRDVPKTLAQGLRGAERAMAGALSGAAVAPAPIGAGGRGGTEVIQVLLDGRVIAEQTRRQNYRTDIRNGRAFGTT